MYLYTSSRLVLAALLEECCYNPSMFIKFWVGRQEESKQRDFGHNPKPFRHTYPQLHTLPTYMYLSTYL